MPNDATISIIVDASLSDHFAMHLAKAGRSTPPQEAITSLVSMILESSRYPISAERTGKTEIRISYHFRSFSQPIFD